MTKQEQVELELKLAELVSDYISSCSVETLINIAKHITSECSSPECILCKDINDLIKQLS